MAAAATALYERLKELGCAPCAECDGSYMFPDHVKHQRLFNVVEPAADTVEDVPA